jgi:hypothetical protein
MVTWQVSLAAHSSAAAALVLWNRVPVRYELPAFAAAGSGASGRTSHPSCAFRFARRRPRGWDTVAVDRCVAPVECELIFYAKPTWRGGHVDI